MMRKNLFLFILFSVLYSLFSVKCFAQETLTITTYYPSPYGSYQELRAQRMAIGDTYYQRATVCWDASCPAGSVTPAGDTDLVVEGNVGIGTTSPGSILHVEGVAPSLGVGIGIVSIVDNTAMDADVGGNLSFRGKYTAAGATAGFGGIKAGKANATDGNLNSYLALYTRNNTGGILERMRIDTTGNVGIGTVDPAHRLEVEGNVRVDTLILTPRASAPTPAEDGMMYFNSNDKKIYYYAEGKWRNFAYFDSVLLGRKQLSSLYDLPYALPTVLGGGRPDRLEITTPTPQRGLYSISWGGILRIDANSFGGASLTIRYAGKTIDWLTFRDDDYIKDGNYTEHEVSGGTLVQLEQDTNYRIRIEGFKNTKDAVNDSEAQADFWIQANLILPF